MSTISSSKLAYLSKYTNEGVSGKEKKKKRKKKKKLIKKQDDGGGVVVDDDDLDVGMPSPPRDDEDEENGNDDAEDGPIVVGVEEQERIKMQEGTGQPWKDEVAVARDVSTTTNHHHCNKQRRRHDSSDDQEGESIDQNRPRRRKRHDSDDEDDDSTGYDGRRRKRHDSDDDSSQQRRGRRHDSSDDDVDHDEEPGRRRRHDYHRYRHDSDDEPSARRRRHPDSEERPRRHRHKLRHRRRHDSDELSSPPRRRRHDSDNNDDDDHNLQNKRDKMSSGHVAGLQQAEGFRRAEGKLQRRRREEARAMVDRYGVGETVYRDAEGRKVDASEIKDKRQQVQQLDAETQARLNKGRVQREQEEAHSREWEELQQSSFARHETDEGLEASRRDAIREGDPMAAQAAKKQAQVRAKSGKPVRPVYKGPPPKPNRYGIRPGYRWDGFDRSNGFEDKVLARQYSAHRKKEDAYRWSSADM